MQVPIRPPTMTVAEQRSHFPELLSQVDDEFFSTVYAMLATYVRKQTQDEVIGYRVGTNDPVLASEADDEFEAIVDDVKAGNYVTIDELIAQKSRSR